MHTTRLRKYLDSRNAALTREVVTQVEQVESILLHTYSTFPSGTNHTSKHTMTVEHIAGMLLTDEILHQLFDDEIALLILSCHFHDLGMAGEESDNETEAGRTQVRNEHAISIGEKIRLSWQQIGFPDENYACVLAEVCRGHRPDRKAGIACWDNLQEHRLVGPGRYVRLRLVAAMIYAADELHVGHDRASRREEDWKKIKGEALRHWRRHQSIIGPTKIGEDICFDVWVSAFSFESDVRAALIKAFQAVNALRSQATKSGVNAAFPNIRVQWIRSDLWRWLVTESCLDFVPKTEIEIRDAAASKFDTWHANVEPLPENCTEIGETSDTSQSIRVAIKDFVIRKILVATSDGGKLWLNPEARSAEQLLAIAKRPDEFEKLFGPRLRVEHDYAIWSSKFGREYIREHIFPKVKESFDVDVAALEDSDPLKIAIRCSPTASRLIQSFESPLASQSKADVLLSLIVAGLMSDIIKDAEILLDKDIRKAVAALFDRMQDRLPRSLRLSKQLALVMGLSPSQVAEASISQSASVESETGAFGSVHVTQEFPKEKRGMAFPYLCLASLRAGETVKIMNTDFTPLVITAEGVAGDFAELSNTAPVSISIGPGVADLPKNVTIRATPYFDRQSKTLEFRSVLAGEPNCIGPVIMQIPGRLQKRPVESKISVFFPELTVSQALDLQDAATASQEGSIEFRIVLPNQAILGRHTHTPEKPFRFPQLMNRDLLMAIMAVQADCSFPYFAPNRFFDDFVQLSESQRYEKLKEVRLRNEKRPQATSIVLRLANENGRDYHEEFLGFLPLNTRFAAPKFYDPRLIEAQFQELWDSAEAPIELSTCHRDDVEYLARLLKEWAKEKTGEFPLSLGENSVTTHFCRTNCDRIHGELIDRHWYVERPVIIRLRPASRLEQYRVEKEYWEEVGDEQRALLLQELIDAEPPATVGAEAANAAIEQPPTQDDVSSKHAKPSTAEEPVADTSTTSTSQ